MPPRKRAAVPPARRRTLIEWIEHDNGNSADISHPACSSQVQMLHTRIFLDPQDNRNEAQEPLQLPPDLRLPPLG